MFGKKNAGKNSKSSTAKSRNARSNVEASKETSTAAKNCSGKGSNSSKC